MVCRLLIYHVKPMLICHLIATMRGSYNTGAAANLNTISDFRSSLRSLLVHVRESGSTLLKYNAEDLEQIRTEGTGFCELSVALPQMYLSENCPLSRWEAFLVWHSRNPLHQSPTSSKHYQDSTRELQNLITLNIQDWPDTVNVTIGDPNQCSSTRASSNE